MLIPGKLHGTADAVAHRIIGAISTPMEIDGTSCEVGACVGIAHYPGDVEDTAALLRAADLAMYQAKRAGRNGARAYDSSLQDAASERSEQERELRLALRNKSIQPFFQPLVDLETGRIQGFEALARWTKPNGVSVPPSDFIKLAEELGLIVELSDQLLRMACQEAVRWPADIQLSFNISPAQLTDSLLGLRILKILGETGLLPSRLEIEITEGTFVRDTATALIIIRDLKRAGIRIALDDFGTGYSSMSQLASLSIDKIKIDRSFVAGSSNDERQMNIVKAIISLSRSLGLKTTAEGIEERSQLADMKALGCETGQGYLFGKAMPAEAISDLLALRDPVPSLARRA